MIGAALIKNNSINFYGTVSHNFIFSFFYSSLKIKTSNYHALINFYVAINPKVRIRVSNKLSCVIALAASVASATAEGWTTGVAL